MACAVAFLALAGDFFAAGLEPLAALARILFLVSAEGLFSWDVLAAGELGDVFTVSAARRGARTAALTLELALTLGNFIAFLGSAFPLDWPRAFEAAAGFRDVVVAFATAFLTPALIDLALRILRFLVGEGVVVAVPRFRFVPALAAFFVVVAASVLVR